MAKKARPPGRKKGKGKRQSDTSASSDGKVSTGLAVGATTLLVVVAAVVLRTSWREADHGIVDDVAQRTSKNVPFCQVAPHLSSEAVPGFHVLCVRKSSDGSTLHTTAFMKGQQPNITFSSKPTWTAWRGSVEEHLRIPDERRDSNTAPINVKFKLQPWSVFTSHGRPLTSVRALLAPGRVVYVMEGGQFVWPGIRVGHERVVPGLKGWDSKPVVLRTLSMKPLVVSVSNFLSPSECKKIIASSEPHMAPSTVKKMNYDQKTSDNHWRTSTTYFLRSREAWLHRIDRRVEALTRIQRRHQEAVQVLRYELSQFYDSHHDYLDPKYYKGTDGFKYIDNGTKNRLATVFWYMSNVTKGGETFFPRAGGLPPPASLKGCNGPGLRVKPREGNVIIFYSMLPSGDLDPYSLHGACPIEEGVKWAANKWIWNKAYE